MQLIRLDEKKKEMNLGASVRDVAQDDIGEASDGDEMGFCQIV